MDIKKVFVVGAGTMGSGIAQVCAQSGIRMRRRIPVMGWSVYVEEEG
jgi:3-hydroxyacyl-CoA dehydrogenase